MADFFVFQTKLAQYKRTSFRSAKLTLTFLTLLQKRILRYYGQISLSRLNIEKTRLFNLLKKLRKKKEYAYHLVASSNERYKLGNQLFVKRSHT